MKRLAAIAFLGLLWFALATIGAQAAPAPPNSTENCPSPAIVASFLRFTEAQAEQYGQLLSQFQTTLHGLQEHLSARQAQLDTLLNQPNPNPAVVGVLVLQIHALQQQVVHAIQSYQGLFAGLLTQEQKQKAQEVTLASQLQPAVGAFVALYLAPAPTPLPCQKE